MSISAIRPSSSLRVLLHQICPMIKIVWWTLYKFIVRPFAHGYSPCRCVARSSPLEAKPNTGKLNNTTITKIAATYHAVNLLTADSNIITLPTYIRNLERSQLIFPLFIMNLSSERTNASTVFGKCQTFEAHTCCTIWSFALAIRFYYVLNIQAMRTRASSVGHL